MMRLPQINSLQWLQYAEHLPLGHLLCNGGAHYSAWE